MDNIEHITIMIHYHILSLAYGIITIAIIVSLLIIIIIIIITIVSLLLILVITNSPDYKEMTNNKLMKNKNDIYLP